MAKDKRYPSPANVAVDKSGKPVAVRGPAGPMPERKVEGKKVDLVEVTHSGKGTIVLHNGTHSLVPGVNQIARDVMDEAKGHPHIAKLLKDGVLKIAGEKAAPAEEESKDESEEESKKGDSKDESEDSLEETSA
jgi:hypothetical protein